MNVPARSVDELEGVAITRVAPGGYVHLSEKGDGVHEPLERTLVADLRHAHPGTDIRAVLFRRLIQHPAFRDYFTDLVLGLLNHSVDSAFLQGLLERYAYTGVPPGNFNDIDLAEFMRRRPAWVVRDLEAVVGAGPMPCRPRAVATSSVTLVGDAAGYVEPFTGEGMSWALTSAEVLADVAADQSPGDWTRAAASRYRRAWRDRIGHRQRLCRAVAWSLQRPRLLGVLASAVARPGPLTRGLVGKMVTP